VDNSNEPITSEELYVVGIGASAGGLEALQQFFAAMPPAPNLAFVVIQHLSPDYKSLMVELLSKHTRMEVLRSDDGMVIEPQHVYLIPPKTNLEVKEGRLRLTDYDPRQSLNLPIDVFFRSLAQDQGERGIGIVLSGTGSDGTRGIKTIKEAGGLILAQDIETARFDGMPGSAIATGLVDIVSAPDRMPGELLNYINHPSVRLAVTQPEPEVDESTLSRITTLLRRTLHVDFANYKPNTLLRRIQRRMGIVQVNTMEAYHTYLQHSPQEARNLYKDFLIGVTKFFRDSEAFQIIREKVIPKLFESAEKSQQIRLWIAGCATGEEAYSFALLLHAYADKIEWPGSIKVFATDIDQSAVEFASIGRYPESIAADVPTELLSAFFDNDEHHYRIKRRVRDSVIFATQDLLKDPPFTRIDLVSCRNMLIYLKVPAQQRVLKLCQFALRSNGYLFLGSSETVGEYQESFEVLSSKWRLYRNRNIGPITLDEHLTAARVGPRETAGGDVRVGRQTYLGRIVDRARDDLIEQFAPNSLLIDSNFALLHTFGKPFPWLRQPTGRATLNVLDMLPRPLSLAVATAIKKLENEGEPIRYAGMRVDEGGMVHRVDLRVEPMRERPNDNGEPHYLLIIRTEETTEKRVPEAFNANEKADERIEDLEKELQFTRENLQATIEELETSNEELQATNEELLAANEELQSTNEELESVNEELYTVNSEYQGKISELTELNADLDNLLRSAQMGLIFLDDALHIRRFSPTVAEALPLRAADLERPLREIAHPLIPEIIKLSEEVLKGIETRPQTVKDQDKEYLLAGTAYQTLDGVTEGVVVTLTDVSIVQTLAADFAESRDRFRQIIEKLDIGICINDEEGNFVQVNESYLKFYGYTWEEIKGKPFTMVVPEDYREDAMRIYQEFMQTGHEIPRVWDVVRKDGSGMRVSTRASLFKVGGESFKVTVISDVTDIQDFESALANLQKDFDRL